MTIQVVNQLIHEGQVYSGDGAIFSPDYTHRYLLTRRLGFQSSTCLFILLNPSTADAARNDPTVTRCINFARWWGSYGRVEVCNIFAYRATDPKELYRIMHDEAIGAANNNQIMDAIRRADRVVCGWGNHGALDGRGEEVHAVIVAMEMIPLVFKITKQGQPIHPLYQPRDQPLMFWPTD